MCVCVCVCVNFTNSFQKIANMEFDRAGRQDFQSLGVNQWSLCGGREN